MKRTIKTLLATAVLAMPAATLAADLPQRGMTQAQVKDHFGAPNSIKGPVGSPAITRWNYGDFTVYFENDLTLHTVVDRPATQPPVVVSGSTSQLPPIEEISGQDNQPQAPATSPEAAPAADSSGMAFDPVTGQFLPAGTPPEAAAQPAAEPQSAPVEAPQSTPQPATKTQAASPESTQPSAPATDQDSSQFAFDPVTGRIIIADDPASAPAEQVKEAVTEQAAETEAAAQQLSEQAQQQLDAAQQSADDVAAEAEENAEDVKQSVEETRDDAEAKAKQAKDSAQQAAEKTPEGGEEGSGFYIDWGSAQ